MINQYQIVDGVFSVAQAQTKTLDDVYRVVDGNKSALVVDQFVAMYLLSDDPHQKVKDQWYAAHSRIAELEALQVDETVDTPYFDDAGNTYAETTVVRAARELTDLESAELAANMAVRSELETGIKTVPVSQPADIESWDADQIEAWALSAYDLNIDKRFSVENILANQIPESIDVRGDVFSPWLAAYRGASDELPPVYEVTADMVSEFKTANARIHTLLRDRAVEKIVVEPAPDLPLQGDEMSQTRMSRALVVALGEAIVQIVPAVADVTTPWKTADNRVEQVSIGQLLKGLRTAGELQTEVFTDVV